MDDKPLDTIAEKRVEIEVAGGPVEVTLRVGRPIPDAQLGGDWTCPYTIVGNGIDRRSAAFGIDAVQALILGLVKASLDLEALGRASEA